jgi:hypothetical protein
MRGFNAVQPCTHYTKLKIKFTLQQATKAHGGVEVQLYSFFNLGARWGGWSTPPPGRRFTPIKDPVSIA